MVRALFPGTFDPIHYGHMDIANRASKLFDEVVMAVYDKPLKNLLFSPEERMTLVTEAVSDNPKIKVTGYSGLTIEFAQRINAHVIVRGLRVFSDFEFEFRMALANQRLAGAAVETVALITAEQHTFLSSSTVREIAALNGDVSSMVPPYVELALKEKVSQMGEQSLPNALRD
ncbi:MAG: pantetheine-phosphate adenylyltransferase [Anaerolineales bacterium]|nr:pantetheine-phosphate adenylyltransferase [Anaerolineales bacterium]MCB9110001.1 pantetheine-phosphate adenylyltransferase [Anaerolineales bacterium]